MSWPRTLRVVGTPKLAEDSADLADRAVRLERLTHRNEQVPVALRGLAHLGEPRGRGVGVALGAHRGRPLALSALDLGIDLEDLDALRLVLDVAVDADDDPLARLDVRREAERGLLDLVLDEALLDRRDRAAQLVDALDELLGTRLELARQRLDGVRAAERVGRVVVPTSCAAPAACAARSAAARSVGSASASSNEFVWSDCAPPQTADERLDRDAHDVELRLLGGERGAPGLRVEAERRAPAGSSRRSARA